ncbi:Zn-ribbon domain-containing OB-fold protein [Chloroflexota bacterium]
MSDATARKRIPIREGLLTSPLSPLEDVMLQGSKCRNCGEVALGISSSCQNCAGEELDVIPLSKDGILWTYTVIRNRPPGDYKGPDPFVPFGEGLVELPEGIRVKIPLGGDPERLKIDMNMRFHAYKLFEDTDGNEVIAFRFDPVQEKKHD